MELAKLTSKGQITIPRDVREKMKLKVGDKILFFEENGKYFLQNTNSIVWADFQKAMEGAAKEAGFNSPEDVVKYMKKIKNSNEQ
jgi:AbrB family looped-hinge helix DNA binding protein